MKIKIRPSFATGEECRHIVEQFRRVKKIEPTVRESIARSEMSAISLVEHGDDAIVQMRTRVLTELRHFFGTNDLWLECSLLSEMRAGDHIPLHADNEHVVAGDWEPNHTPFRSHAAILYLNAAGPGQDFSGGTLNFPSRALELIPATGTLVSFPCDRRFEHEVFPIDQGNRYTLAIWFTTDPAREEPWT